MDRADSTTPPSVIRLPGVEPRPGTRPGPFVRPSKLVIADVAANNTPAVLVNEIYRLRHRVQELEALLPPTPPDSAAPSPDGAGDEVLMVQRSLSATSMRNPTALLPRQFKPAPASLPPGYLISSSPALRYTHFSELYDVLTQHPSIYWGQERSKEAFARQLERSWRCLFVVKRTKRKDELAGFCRVVSDGEGCVVRSVLVPAACGRANSACIGLQIRVSCGRFYREHHPGAEIEKSSMTGRRNDARTAPQLPGHQRQGLANIMIHDAIEQSARGRECSETSGKWKWFVDGVGDRVA